MILSPSQRSSLDRLTAEYPDARELGFDLTGEPYWTLRTRKTVMIGGRWTEIDMTLTKDATGFHERPAGIEP